MITHKVPDGRADKERGHHQAALRLRKGPATPAYQSEVVDSEVTERSGRPKVDSPDLVRHTANIAPQVGWERSSRKPRKGHEQVRKGLVPPIAALPLGQPSFQAEAGVPRPGERQVAGEAKHSIDRRPVVRLEVEHPDFRMEDPSFTPRLDFEDRAFEVCHQPLLWLRHGYRTRLAKQRDLLSVSTESLEQSHGVGHGHAIVVVGVEEGESEWCRQKRHQVQRETGPDGASQTVASRWAQAFEKERPLTRPQHRPRSAPVRHRCPRGSAWPSPTGSS